MSHLARQGLLDRTIVVNIFVGVLVAAVFVTVTMLAYRAAVTQTKDAALYQAQSWYSSTLAHIDKVDRILSGDGLTAAERARVRRVSEAARLVGYGLYTEAGLLVRSAQGTIIFDVDDYPAAREEARRVLAAGQPSARMDLAFHDAADGTTFVSVFLPIFRDGVAVAVVNASFDETSVWRSEMSTFWQTTAGLALLAALALTGTALMALMLQRQRRHEARIAHLATHDPLTGLCNRTAFAQRLRDAVSVARRSGDGVALFMLDVDRFKSINDLMGHDVGDAALRAVASTLSARLDKRCTIARLGGDEFAILQPGVRVKEQAEQTGRTIVEAVRQIEVAGETPLSITTSVGGTVATNGDEDELQRLADAALYYAKEAGRDQFVMFKDGMDQAFRRRSALRTMVRDALKKQTFQLYYQPLHEAATGDLIAFEALLRMPDGSGGFVSPAEFVPVAEEMSVTPVLGAWVLREATKAATKWPAHLRVSVNLSPQQFQSDIVGVVEDALRRSGLDPRRLELEVTENLCITDPALVGRELTRLKALGARIVMDDFGTGYSSLQHLWTFPFDKLKVDRSCMMSLDESENVAEVMRTISAMSGAMKLTVTAEGVETDAHANFARDAGYDEVQGFLYSRPMPLGAIGDYIGRYRDGTATPTPDNANAPAPLSQAV
ncbi:MAG: EAL domain-containing protein [Pseudomonadota bacterium]